MADLPDYPLAPFGQPGIGLIATNSAEGGSFLNCANNSLHLLPATSIALALTKAQPNPMVILPVHHAYPTCRPENFRLPLPLNNQKSPL